jgi:1-deoxy-D-xylulose-5-phosphate synthase
VDWRCPLEGVEVGKGRQLKQGENIAILTLGPIGNLAADAIKIFEEKHTGTTVAHYDLRFLKPLDEDMLSEIGKKFQHIITVEDGCLQGGMGSAVLEWFADKGLTPRVIRIGIPDKFIEHGSVPELYELCHMNTESIVEALEKIK